VPPLPEPAWDYEERSRLAEDTVVIALHKFRDTVLIPHRWKPERGATLRTFFIGQCLIRFPNVYRQWLTERHGGAQRLDPLDENTWVVSDVSSPVEQQMVRDTRLEQLLEQAPEERTRRVLQLLAEGYTQKEIAEDLATTAKAVERLIHRHRQRLRPKEGHGQAS
jgi:RNA polymerase sigma factor (sigma-70 family)